MEERHRYKEVGRHITALIDSAALLPGERLPSLRALSRQLRVSIATVTQAYLELEKTGIVEARPRSGYYVRQALRRLPRPESVPRPQLEPIAGNRSRLIQTVLGAVGSSDLLPLGVTGAAPELLPGKLLAKLMAAECRGAPEAAIGYEQIAGHIELRRQIALYLLGSGIAARPEEIIVTTGAMEALYIAIRALTRPGDTVLIQSPTYYCFLQLLESCGLRAVEIPSHPRTGVHPDDLRQALKRFDIRACLLAPNFNNPDGSLTCEEARAEIMAILEEEEVPLIEDDVYGDVHFGPRRPGTLKARDRRGLVLYCNSFSKTIAPGFRVGYLLPGRFFPKALEIKSTTNVTSATPTQRALAAYLRQGHFERHLRRLRQTMEAQMRTLQLHLGCHFPAGTRVTQPEGGGALWVELPPGVDGVEYFYRARAEGIGVVPGSVFSTQDRFGNYVRLSCNGLWNEDLARGVETLGRIAAEMA
ncbi:PLP-dependent aminotransferase family protein [Desulfuromonas sp.]|uniref:aminotransferase-like domain-containing protein n=1 Tax=Desulfuromonas sp. TaxID=892 RepID=UPI0025C48B59|nr:PLP-dependent aminotransferase family protein [Desulfuromonas sp.]